MTWRKALVLGLTMAVLVRGQTTSPADQTQAATEFLRQGRYSDAEKQFQGALAGCNRSQCSELPAILNGLGCLYYEQGRYREAEPVLLRAIEILGGARETNGCWPRLSAISRQFIVSVGALRTPSRSTNKH